MNAGENRRGMLKGERRQNIGERGCRREFGKGDEGCRREKEGKRWEKVK
jgi:hypothetical protein